MAKIHVIIDEGFFSTTMDQMLEHFSENGMTAIYIRAFDSKHHPETMLASTEPITDEIYAAWCEAKHEGTKEANGA